MHIIQQQICPKNYLLNLFIVLCSKLLLHCNLTLSVGDVMPHDLVIDLRTSKKKKYL